MSYQEGPEGSGCPPNPALWSWEGEDPEGRCGCGCVFARDQRGLHMRIFIFSRRLLLAAKGLLGPYRRFLQRRRGCLLWRSLHHILNLSPCLPSTWRSPPPRPHAGCTL